jgi:hypothetical protein
MDYITLLLDLEIILYVLVQLEIMLIMRKDMSIKTCLRYCVKSSIIYISCIQL